MDKCYQENADHNHLIFLDIGHEFLLHFFISRRKNDHFSWHFPFIKTGIEMPEFLFNQF